MLVRKNSLGSLRGNPVLRQAKVTKVKTVPDGIAGTHVTVGMVLDAIRRKERHPLVFAQSQELVRDLPSLDAYGRRNKRAEAQAIYDLVERAIRYTDHPAYADGYIAEPDFVLAHWHEDGRPVAADCVGQTMLVAALARNLSIPVRLRVIGVKWPQLDFHHIHPELHVDGQWLAADVTATTATSRKIREAAQLGFRAGAGLEQLYYVQ